MALITNAKVISQGLNNNNINYNINIVWIVKKYLAANQNIVADV